MGIFDFIFGNKKKKEKELLLKQQEQERLQREEYLRQQKLDDERREKERAEWLAENHKKATERNARLSALREHMKEVTKDIDAENEKRRIEQDKRMQEEKKRLEKEQANRIEMSRRKALEQSKSTRVLVPQNIQNIIDAASIGLVAAQNGNHRIEQENLINLFNLTQDKSSQLLHIPADKYNLVGSGFCLLLEYPQVQANEDISRAIADYAFFCISKAIEHDPGNKTLYLKRMTVVAQTREFFFYTVANALEIPDSNPFDIMLSAPLIVRTNDFIYAMGKYDFENGDNIVFVGKLKEFHDLCYGPYVRKTANEGKIYIDKVNDYIANSISRY
ncbi:MAG: hypothetical protein IJK46_07640 [Prevotella sp.]|nr:hypothetical protein [Prevotella sp.]